MSLKYYPKIILPVCLNIQDTTYGCGPASLKIIFDTLGIHLSEEKLMKMTKITPKGGTKPAELVKVLTELRIKHKEISHASIEMIEDKIRSLNLCLVDYQAWGEGGTDYKGLKTGHYSVVFGFDKIRLWIADPAKHHSEKQRKWGARKIRKDIFVQNWADKEVSGIETHHWLIAVPLVQTLKHR